MVLMNNGLQQSDARSELTERYDLLLSIITKSTTTDAYVLFLFMCEQSVGGFISNQMCTLHNDRTYRISQRKSQVTANSLTLITDAHHQCYQEP